MDVSFATEACPGRDNQDYVVASDRFAVVLDGVTPLPYLDNGCVHDVPWLARTLGMVLADLLSRRGDESLTGIAEEAIAVLRTRHGGSCDLDNPDSPSATVAMLRVHADAVDHFVLCDSSIVFDMGSGYRVVTDDRTARLPAYDAGTVARLRNAPGGFWVASTNPVAAQHALTGSTPLSDVRRAAVLTDGAARLVERFGQSWQDVFSILDRAGPRGVLDAVRTAELTKQPAVPGHRGKQFDDAALALCEFRASVSD
ncbi:protein phosphatase 2C domain-containing protein [Micromonospora polyrhachis]|uniref:PPM-type phosphatase domain-containing protein n=1 Tax=Micromonospora polyrhachis TaxID=1282883 RepID=A0A7W7SUE4_9ACTN|nr:protein phosphatase 2C domain-containing protein [Micromonospora polyrhachis]MBB4961124.1 hypothetical protein [Micromonospora polyrhachis]